MKEGITGAHFWKVVNRWKMYSFLMATNNNASTHFQNRQKRSLLCMNCGTFQTLEKVTYYGYVYSQTFN
jgi:hypothetical protein